MSHLGIEKLSMVKNISTTSHAPSQKIPSYGIEKLAGTVKIPEGGLKSGLFFNDLTKLMTKKDSEKVKKKYNIFKRSGPGLIPMALAGGTFGGAVTPMVKSLISGKNIGASSIKGAITGAILAPLIVEGLTRFGAYDKDAIMSAKQLVKKASSTSYSSGQKSFSSSSSVKALPSISSGIGGEAKRNSDVQKLLVNKFAINTPQRQETTAASGKGSGIPPLPVPPPPM